MKGRRIREIRYSSHFARALKTIPKQHLYLLEEREAVFRDNCFDARLKTHKLQGKLKRFWSFSLTHQHRVLFEFLDDQVVAFVDVGNHALYQ